MSGSFVQSCTVIERAVGAVSRKVHGLGGVFLALMMFITAVDVVGRYIFNSPIKGTTEINELALVVMAVSYTHLTLPTTPYV